MAIIKCPECGKEISDKAEVCPSCGYPIAGKSIGTLEKKDNSKIVKILAGVVIVGILGGIGYNQFVVKPKKLAEQKAVFDEAIELVTDQEYESAISLLKTIPEYDGVADEIENVKMLKEQKETYATGIALLEKGKYSEGIDMLNTIPEYADVATVLEEAKYESYAYSAVKAVKGILKNPDSLSVYDIYFFSSNSSEEDTENETEVVTESEHENAESEEYPYIVMYIGAQNGFGGNTTSYAGCIYDEESGEYVLDAYTHELDVEELDEDDEDYFFFYISATLIQAKLDNGQEIGTINRERFDAVLKSSSYSAIKIID